VTFACTLFHVVCCVLQAEMLRAESLLPSHSKRWSTDYPIVCRHLMKAFNKQRVGRHGDMQ
jgi:hypothetical protein